MSQQQLTVIGAFVLALAVSGMAGAQTGVNPDKADLYTVAGICLVVGLIELVNVTLNKTATS